MDVHQDRTGTDALRPVVVSPGLAAAKLGAAFELKFQLTEPDADRILEWARANLSPDQNGDNGRYRVTSLYCDTPVLDVFHRSPGFKRTKFRVRRYDGTPHLFLERKTKRNDQVQKRRSQVRPDDLAYLAARVAEPHAADGPTVDGPTAGLPDGMTAWPGEWFLRRVRQRGLRPTCCVTYRRAAFFGMAGDAPIRMTLDRDVAGLPADGWAVPQVDGGHPLMPGGVLLEMKFHLHLPPLFRELLALLPGQASKASKYRRCVTECGLWDGSLATTASTAGLAVDEIAPAPARARADSVDGWPAAAAADVRPADARSVDVRSVEVPAPARETA
jgi:hypothetical protein